MPRVFEKLLAKQFSRVSLTATTVFRVDSREVGGLCFRYPLEADRRHSYVVHHCQFGDARTRITHSATTSHGCLTDEERASAGISVGLVRMVGGVEDIEYIKTDLLQGLIG